MAELLGSEDGRKAIAHVLTLTLTLTIANPSPSPSPSPDKALEHAVNIEAKALVSQSVVQVYVQVVCR